jgi:hypothetical protein
VLLGSNILLTTHNCECCDTLQQDYMLQLVVVSSVDAWGGLQLNSTAVGTPGCLPQPCTPF